MIAITISMGLLYGVASMMTFNARTTKSIELSGDFNSLVSTIQTIINNESSCKTVFSGKSFTASVVGQIDPGTSSSLPSLELNGLKLAEVGQPATGLKITKIEFDKIETVLPDVTVAGVLNKQYMVNLHLAAEKTMSGGVTAVGGSQKNANFKFSILVESGQITGCYGGNSVTESASQTCADLGGIYNPTTTPKCSLPVNTIQMQEICTSMGGGSWDSINNRCIMTPVNCTGFFSACSKDCGTGTQSYTVSQNSLNGGSACPYVTGYVQTCNTQGCLVPINCAGDWGVCSETCGGGTQTYRHAPSAANNGQQCTIAEGTSQACNTDACHGELIFRGANNGTSGAGNIMIAKGVTSIKLTMLAGGGGGGGANECDMQWLYPDQRGGMTTSSVCGGGSGCTGGVLIREIAVNEKTLLFFRVYGSGIGGRGGMHNSGNVSEAGQAGTEARVTIGSTSYSVEGGGGGKVANYYNPDKAKGCSNPPSGGIAGNDGEKVLSADYGGTGIAHGGASVNVMSLDLVGAAARDGSGGRGGNYEVLPLSGSGWGDGLKGEDGFVKINW